MSTLTTVTGNLTADPELRYLDSGIPVANLTIADTPRVFNKQKDEWEDGGTVFIRATLWREAAENLTQSLTKGQRVIATGKLKQSNWEKDGEKRSSIELDIEEIGPSLKYATASVTKTERRNGNQSVRQTAGAAAGGSSNAGWTSGNTNPPF